MDEMNGAGGAETTDELHAVQQLLTRQPPPSPNVVASARATLERAAAAQSHGSSAASQRRGWAAAGRRHTSASGGDLLQASKRVPIPSRDISVTARSHVHLSGRVLVTGDGSAIVAATAAATVHGRQTPAQAKQEKRLSQELARLSQTLHADKQRHAPAEVIKNDQRRIRQVMTAYGKVAFPEKITSDVAITEFSTRTGRPERVLYAHRAAGQAALGVEWTDPTGAVVIGENATPGKTPSTFDSVMGIFTRSGFTPLPNADQHFYANEPIW